MEKLSPQHKIIEGFDSEITEVGGISFSYPGIATVQAYTKIEQPYVLNIEDINVVKRYERNGYGGSLVDLIVEYARVNGIQTITAGVIHPTALRLLSASVGFDNILIYEDREDLTTLLTDVTLEEACARIAALAAQAAEYDEMNVDFPTDFDPGLYVVASIKS